MSEASRLEASIGMAEWVETDVTGLLNQCAEGYRAVHPDRHIETRLPESARPILCAPELLAQALDKLVDNALSFCGPDDTVTIRLESTADGVEISVRNTGSSLPDSYQDRLFDSLVSVREKHDEMPHLGLGLYIVKLVANAHRGSVSAQNVSAGNGVVFSLNIPG